MAGKIYQVAFQLAGKLGSSFGSTFLSATKSINKLDVEIKKLKADMKNGGDKTALQAQINSLSAQKVELSSAHQAANKFKSSVSSAFKSAAVTAGIATTAVSAYYGVAMKLANGVMEHALHAKSAAAIAGTSVEWYQSMAYAANYAGVSAENFDKSLAKMSINLGSAKSGNKAMVEVFDKLGIKATELKNLQPEEAFSRITKALNGVSDAAVRTDLARKVFGKVGTSMIPLAKMSAAQIQKLQSEAKKLGVVLDQSAIDQTKAYITAKKHFNATFDAFKTGIGRALMPGLVQGMQTISKLAVKYQPAIRRFANGLGNGIKEATPEVIKAVKAMANVAGAAYAGARFVSKLIGGFHNLVYIGAAWIGLKMAVSFWQTTTAMSAAVKGAMSAVRAFQVMGGAARLLAGAQMALNVAMRANPIGMVIMGATALIAAGYAIYRNWDRIKVFFINLWNSPARNFILFATGPIGLIIAAGVNLVQNWESVKQWFTLLWNDPGAAVEQFVNVIRSKFTAVFDWLSDKWKAVKGIFSAGGDGGGSAGDIPGHAAGGFFNREHIARFAEGDKPEAVIPLSDPKRGLAIWAKVGQMFGLVKQNRQADVLASPKGASGDRELAKSGGIWAQASNLLQGKQPGKVKTSKGGNVFNLNQNITIPGGSAEAAQTGINKANQDAKKMFEDMLNEEERLSYA